MNNTYDNTGSQAVVFGLATGFMQACSSVGANIDLRHLLVAAVFACVTGFCYRMAGRLADRVRLGKRDSEDK